MTKREALIVLIQHSYFLTEKVKFQLSANLDKLTDEDVENLGKFLAMEKKVAIEKHDEMVADLEKLKKDAEEALKKVEIQKPAQTPDQKLGPSTATPVTKPVGQIQNTTPPPSPEDSAKVQQ